MPAALTERRLCRDPDRMVALVDPEIGFGTEELADYAVDMARSIMPKVTGALASTLRPMHGIGFFGIYFPDRRVWFLERGTQARTMRNLAGKTIPMWIDDPTGAERRNNPKARVRTTEDGRAQILIFRRVGVKGGQQGKGTRVSRYPGQPGRITRREAAAPLTTAGRTGGRIAKGNIGVAWRNPGIVGRQFLNYAMTAAIQDGGMDTDEIYLVDSPTFYGLVRL